MTVSLNIIDELWDLEKPIFPPRTHLFCLQPISIGTPYVESLASYVARLAEAHSVTTGKLITHEIIPCEKVKYMQKSLPIKLSSTGFKKIIRCLKLWSGTGKETKFFIEKLQSLIGRKNLHFLTMLTFSEVIPNKYLFRECKAWCPVCYQNWRTSCIYDPLIWTLKVFTICPYHCQILQTHCPKCHKTNPFLDANYRPGYCSKCSQWLGSYKFNESLANQNVSKEEVKWQIWVFDNVGDLLKKAPFFSSILTRNRIKTLIAICIDKATKGNKKTFAKLLGKSEGSVKRWCNGGQIPNLHTLLQICYFSNVSLLVLFTVPLTILGSNNVANNEESLVNETLQDKAEKNLIILDREKQFLNDLNLIEQALKGALHEYPPPSLKMLRERLGLTRNQIFYEYFSDLSYQVSSYYSQYCKCIKQQRVRSLVLAEIGKNEYPPPTLELVVTRIKLSYSVLYKACPDLCQMIVKRAFQYRHLRAIQRVEKHCEQVRCAVLILHERGINPNLNAVKKCLIQPLILLNPIVVSTLYEMRHELGYEE
ncbi:MAG: TniQ family protein [Nostoc sp.]|uniref:TniQ family protein n=1 Tax=Nostoc sp. TaxID=1180 RepID=UPI002FFBD1EB